MGIAAYWRGNAVISVHADRQAKATRQSLDLSAELWRDLMTAGRVLTWRDDAGRTFTAGQYQQAVGPVRYAILDDRESRIEASAWSIALWVVARVGRKRPDRVS